MPIHDPGVSAAGIDVFRGLSTDVLKRVLSVTRSADLPANAPLLMAGEVGEAVYFVQSGTICIYKEQPSGGRFILNLVGAGETIGEVCALDRKGHSASAITTEPARLLRMRREEFRAFEQQIPELSENVKNLLTRRFRFLSARCEALAPYDVQRRLARLLIALAERYRQESQSLNAESLNERALVDEVLIPLRLTQNDLADMAGVSRPHLNKNLASLEHAGCVVHQARYRLVVRNRELLEKLAS